MALDLESGGSAALFASLIDEGYPIGVPLTAQFKRGFAFKTIGHRLPVILTKVIDQLSRDKNSIGEKLGLEAREEVKIVVGALAKLKNEMITNKPITRTGCPVWDSYLDQMSKLYFDGKTECVKWYFAPWLFVECYLYKRLHDSFQLTKNIKSYDPFRQQKEDGWTESVEAAIVLGDFLDSASPTNEILQDFLEISLWGNRCDLSISCGEGNSQTANVIHQLVELKKMILCDESTKLWETLGITERNGTENGSPKKEGCKSIGYILDNAGFELFTDLCLADVLLNVVDRIDFHVKVIPWFVSDCMINDFKWLLDSMENAQDKPILVKLARKWKGHLSSGKWTLTESTFWTYPHAFHEMSSADPKLYSVLSQNTHLIFKGDLNYRKLIGDINWPTDSAFKTSLQGFCPAPLLTLRTLKADCVSGLKPGLADEIAAKNPDWMTTGEYGVIQHAV